jgi:hypothetical protein
MAVVGFGLFQWDGNLELQRWVAAGLASFPANKYSSAWPAIGCILESFISSAIVS